jgi:hypothetical protein
MKPRVLLLVFPLMLNLLAGRSTKAQGQTEKIAAPPEGPCTVVSGDLICVLRIGSVTIPAISYPASEIK